MQKSAAIKPFHNDALKSKYGIQDGFDGIQK